MAVAKRSVGKVASDIQYNERCHHLVKDKDKRCHHLFERKVCKKKRH